MSFEQLFAEFRSTPFATAQQGQRILVVGGGFYGCMIGLFLEQCGAQVTLVEETEQLLTRASYHNQARVHQGYHYPRSMMTGIRCVVNFQKFNEIFPAAVDHSFTKLYGIARRDSLVTAAQFESFCNRIGAPLRPAAKKHQQLFELDLIEAVYEVQEYAFNAKVLQQQLLTALQQSSIDFQFQQTAKAIRSRSDQQLEVDINERTQSYDAVYCCTYSQLNVLLRDSGLPLLPLKHELTEMALVQVPNQVQELGITVMDGPYFSVMPFPAEQLHSFSHVRYTPHDAWQDAELVRNPQQYLDQHPLQSRFTKMLQDAVRYVPCLSECRYVRSLLQPKTVLIKNERNDGRPILLKKNYQLPGLNMILGGKIDNIFDILQALANSQTAVL
jgi:glycine/D-amino acid oxidase-like deaminating enzyme